MLKWGLSWLLQVCLYCHILIFPIKCAISHKFSMKNKITPFFICWFKFLDNLCSICWSYSCCSWCSSVLPVRVWHSTLSSNISWPNRYCLLLMRKTLTLTSVTVQNIHKNITAHQLNNFLTWILCFLVISFLFKFHPCAPSAKVIASLVNVLKLEDSVAHPSSYCLCLRNLSEMLLCSLQEVPVCGWVCDICSYVISPKSQKVINGIWHCTSLLKIWGKFNFGVYHQVTVITCVVQSTKQSIFFLSKSNSYYKFYIYHSMHYDSVTTM